jgi:microcystin degradation protein MlrC
MTTNAAPVAVAGFWQETNTYSPRETALADFEAFELAEGAAVADLHRGVRSVIGGMLHHLGDRARCALSTGAWPSGPASSRTAELLLDRLDRSLTAVKGCEGVLLNLHGAMVAEGRPDLELDVVQIIRAHLPAQPLVAVLDFHANPSAAFLAECDAVTAYTTYPHVDMFERGAQAAAILDELLRRGTRGRVRVRKLPLLTSPLVQGTDAEPVATLMRRQQEVAGPLGAFVTPGFPYSDVVRAGLTVMANGFADTAGDPGEVVTELANLAWSQRNSFRNRAIAPREALRRSRSLTGRVMLADVGDNVGGGSPGDGTTLLELLLEVEDRRSLVMLWDPATVADAEAVGVGGEFDADLGAHTDERHGRPVRRRVRVESLTDGRYRPAGEWMGGREFEMGACAMLACGAVTVLVTSVLTPPFHVEQVTSQGLRLEDFQILTAKGALAWQDGYGPYVDHALFVDTPGVTPAFPEDLPRKARFANGAGTAEWIFPRHERESRR